MIELKGVSKTFQSKDGSVEACRDIDLTIDSGEIFGIIGKSGAGKSTLVRCINLLERPDAGTVTVDGTELTALPEKELRARRKKIGMIFQLFNLMASRTVYGNVAYALRGAGLAKEQEQEKIRGLLELVGLDEKENAYPSQLSGGQKQRVAVARALACDPSVLLCDECTSALDPGTTAAILKLLKEVNRRLGITIVLITHEMAVAKEICGRIAVMQDGRIVEQGATADIFANPTAAATREFLSATDLTEQARALIESDSPVLNTEEGAILLRLKYGRSSVKQAVISEISRRYNVDASILLGNVEVVGGTTLGNLVLSMTGTKENVTAAVRYLSENEIVVEVLKR
ncbi:MAG: ATP-binding cassette domain-containing protein [Oscillospiraceae bacterium]|nr:ATP-binding cassette domain-containing protein [Oscillospiraceae bacterium]